MPISSWAAGTVKQKVDPTPPLTRPRWYRPWLRQSSRETDPARLRAVQSLEETEDLLPVLRRDANAIVLDFDNPLGAQLFSRNADLYRRLAAIVDRIRDQVLEDSREMLLVAQRHWQRTDNEGGVARLDCVPEIRQNVRDDSMQVQRLRRIFEAANGKSVQALKQRRHSLDAIHNELTLLPRVRANVRIIEQAFREHGNRPKRFPQIVRHGVGKILEPRVAPDQFIRPLLSQFGGYPELSDLPAIDGYRLAPRLIKKI